MTLEPTPVQPRSLEASKGAAHNARVPVSPLLGYVVAQRTESGVRLVETSVGASLAFTGLCLALSESVSAPRSVDVAGMGRLSFRVDAANETMVTFELREMI